MRRSKRGHCQSMLALLFGVLVLAPVTAWGPCHAQELKGDESPVRRGSRDYHRDGFYVGVAATYGLQFFDIGDEEDATGMSLDSTNAWGIDARLGYRFHPNIAAELSAVYLDEFEFESGNGLDVLRLESYAFTGNGKFFFLTGRIQPYALAGAGIMVSRLDSSSFVQMKHRDRLEFLARFGPGVDFYLFDDVVLNAEATYMMPTGALADFPLASFVVGAQYRF